MRRAVLLLLAALALGASALASSFSGGSPGVPLAAPAIRYCLLPAGIEQPLDPEVVMASLKEETVQLSVIGLSSSPQRQRLSLLPAEMTVIDLVHELSPLKALAVGVEGLEKGGLWAIENFGPAGWVGGACGAQVSQSYYLSDLSSTQGQDSLITVFNPSGTQAVLHAEAFLNGSFQDVPSWDGATVPAESLRVFDLRNYLPDEQSLAVRLFFSSPVLVGATTSGQETTFEPGSAGLATTCLAPGSNSELKRVTVEGLIKGGSSQKPLVQVVSSGSVARRELNSLTGGPFAFSPPPGVITPPGATSLVKCSSRAPAFSAVKVFISSGPGEGAAWLGPLPSLARRQCVPAGFPWIVGASFLELAAQGSKGEEVEIRELARSGTVIMKDEVRLAPSETAVALLKQDATRPTWVVVTSSGPIASWTELDTGPPSSGLLLLSGSSC